MPSTLLIVDINNHGKTWTTETKHVHFTAKDHTQSRTAMTVAQQKNHKLIKTLQNFILFFTNITG